MPKRQVIKVNQAMIQRIKELRDRGKTQEEIAVEIGVGQGTISAILRAHGRGGHLPKIFSRQKGWR